MKKSEVFNKLLKVKDNVQIIKDFSDNLNNIDDVTAAQYGIQDIMTEIVDELLTMLCLPDKKDQPKITEETYGTYLSGEDKTIVWHNVYVNGDLVTSELVGWYCGEPDEKSTEEYGKSNTTGYYIW